MLNEALSQTVNQPTEKDIIEISKDDFPDNLNEFSWAGQLPKKLWNKYKKLIIWYEIIALPVFIGVGIGFWFLNEYWLNLAYPLWTLGGVLYLWAFVGIGPIYQLFLVKTAYAINKDDKTGRYYLDRLKWFKKDYGKYSLNNGLYDKKNGTRFLWWLWNDSKKIYELFSPYGRTVIHISNQYVSDDRPAPAELAGIPTYSLVTKAYAQRKAFGFQQAFQYTIFLLILGAEILGIWFLSNKLSEI